MLGELAAVADALAHLGYPVHVGWARQATAQYVILSAPGWGSPDERPLGGASGSLDGPVRVKCVAARTDGALIMARRVRDVLSPGPGRRTRLPVVGRVVEVWWERSEFAAVDESVTLTDGTHPTVTVDTFRVQSERNSG